MKTKAEQARVLFEDGLSVSQVCEKLSMHYSHALSVFKTLQPKLVNDQNNQKSPQLERQPKTFCIDDIKTWISHACSTWDAAQHVIECDDIKLIDTRVQFRLELYKYTRTQTTVSASRNYDESTYGELVCALVSLGFNVTGNLFATIATLDFGLQKCAPIN